MGVRLTRLLELCSELVRLCDFFPSASNFSFLFFLICGLDFAVHLVSQIPHDLYKENGYDHRDALFGIPAYGGSIAQNLYYADSNLCDPNVDATKGYPQREVGKDGKMEPWSTPFILMVDRGGCSFVQKVSINRFVFHKFTHVFL